MSTTIQTLNVDYNYLPFVALKECCKKPIGTYNKQQFFIFIIKYRSYTNSKMVLNKTSLIKLLLK